ncbi:hypothetical protein Sipo8835_37090 [Streptomyces ipomoeae]|uniref:Tat pathway signal sequence domain protein n=2 Tax=Streptomyces ipomoeae TaxID=103232 RepID=L1KS24_9ACTN|nr:hypothetical protein [Streptomyces ipomoeae]EKX63183.1 hypothetical protein STRIP9103_04976 [Streptomyces ipomoeae 91-03]MDX2698707.1 hypothetical protein [Streptomyces ipomoeae]MDX2825474.1 hypothetical protein [Streptomyces ipomoeae]MDX2842928.1 hypothetical protein [Streptomyces ipomoeae]MDX2876904.1 hypothetical protein [Streptomyces ipomoeae]
MHSRLTTRRLATVAVAGAATLAVLAPTASAADLGASQGTRTVASQAAAKLPAKLTVNSYLTYLKTQKTPEAKKTLRSFSALPAAKKARFVTHLQDRKIQEKLLKELSGAINTPKQSVTKVNADVKFVQQVTSKRNFKDAKGATVVSYTVTETIFGIPVTAENLTLHYNVVKGKVQRKARAVARVTNVNAAVAIKGGPVKVAVKGLARAEVKWKLTPKVASFGAAITKQQVVKGHTKVWNTQFLNG